MLIVGSTSRHSVNCEGHPGARGKRAPAFLPAGDLLNRVLRTFVWLVAASAMVVGLGACGSTHPTRARTSAEVPRDLEAGSVSQPSGPARSRSREHHDPGAKPTKARATESAAKARGRARRPPNAPVHRGGGSGPGAQHRSPTRRPPLTHARAIAVGQRICGRYLSELRNLNRRGQSRERVALFLSYATEMQGLAPISRSLPSVRKYLIGLDDESKLITQFAAATKRGNATAGTKLQSAIVRAAARDERLAVGAGLPTCANLSGRSLAAATSR